MTDNLLFDVRERIATITLNRPEKKNAFTTPMLAAWAAALEESARRDDIHVVVLTGTGTAFCSGGDVGRMHEQATTTAYQRKTDLHERVHRIPLLLDGFDKPLIVAINGVATGAGLDMALMGDIRLAARSARFAETYVRLGLFAGDGGSWYLPRIVGMARALEMLWTARFVDANEAERIGLVNAVVDDASLQEASYGLAARIAAQPPIAVRMLKRAARQGMRMELRDHLDMASSHMATIYSSRDHQEAIQAFTDKRPGHFTGA